MHPQDRLFCEIAVQLELLTRDQVAECLRTLQQDPRGRNIGAVAADLGYLSPAETELVIQQQQRVLERRREARAASQSQRDSESRGAAGRPGLARTAPSVATTSPREPLIESRRARLKDPTPTSQWLHTGPAPALAPPQEQVATGGARLTPEQLASAQARETLDVRPPASRRPSPPPLQARPSPTPGAGQLPKSRGPGGTQLGPGRVDFAATSSGPSMPPVPTRPPVPSTRPARSQAPATNHSLPASASLPPSGAASSPPAIKRAPVGGGTLLTGAALAQRHKAAPDAEAAASRSPARPVPQGRDWRNPSQPPPLAALGSEARLSRVGQADALAWPANDAPLRKPKLPSPEAVRYLDAALAVAVESGASDLHVHSGSALHLRIDAKLWPMNGEHALSRENAERVIAEVLDESQWMQLMVDGDLRFAYELPEVGRFRAHAYCQERGTDIVFRILPKQLATPEKLGLTAALGSLPEHVAGLCVCSGPSGSGKTTTLATLAQSIAATRALHVVTVESPIEFVHSPGLGLIEQREVGKHVASFAAGIELAQRQGADLIVVSDLGASGALEASLRAVRGRCLVLGSLRASSSAQALSKLLRATDAQHAERLRAELAYALRLLLHQRLVPRAKGPGRVAALESIVNSAAVAQLIREDKLQQLPAVMAAGKGAGMLSLDEALDELLRAGTISTDSARRAAQRRDRFKST